MPRKRYPSAAITVAEALAEHTPGTKVQREYHGRVSTLINEQIGDYPVAELTPTIIIQTLATIRTADPQGVRSNTLQRAYVSLTGAIADAAQAPELIGFNPMRDPAVKAALDGLNQVPPVYPKEPEWPLPTRRRTTAAKAVLPRTEVQRIAKELLVMVGSGNEPVAKPVRKKRPPAGTGRKGRPPGMLKPGWQSKAQQVREALAAGVSLNAAAALAGIDSKTAGVYMARLDTTETVGI